MLRLDQLKLAAISFLVKLNPSFVSILLCEAPCMEVMLGRANELNHVKKGISA
jgi:hypothetical protein